MKIIGITNDVTTCDCCGRSDLKKTVVLENSATYIVHYGVGCAAQALKMKNSQVEQKAFNAKKEQEARTRFADEQFIRQLANRIKGETRNKTLVEAAKVLGVTYRITRFKPNSIIITAECLSGKVLQHAVDN